MITTERARDGAIVVVALVKAKNPIENPWGAPFLHTRTFYGYTRREARELFRDSLTRDGLTIARDA
jgi:hypothetical protein